jgi:hypothetical protein
MSTTRRAPRQRPLPRGPRAQSPTRRRAPSPSTRLPVAIAISAFTPYLGLPIDIRVEHLIVYGLAIAAVATRSSGVVPRFDQPSKQLLFLWITAGAIITVGTFIARADLVATSRVFFTLSVLDNFLLPVAAFLALTTYALRRDIDTRDGLRAACTATVILLSLNTLLILLVDIELARPLLRFFWTNEANPYLFVDQGGFTSVAARTLTDGRYGGIFNQPYDGGLGYAVGLAAWFVLYTRRGRGRGILGTPAAQFVVLALIVAGGLSTLSKVFIYGGLLVAIASLGLPLTGTRTTIGRSLALLIGAPVAVTTVSELWLPTTSERAFGLLRVYGQDDAVYVATGGRISEFSTYPTRLLDAMTPLGRGWGGIRDDAFLAFVEGAGPLGLLMYLAILGLLFQLVARLPAYSVERRLALSLALLTAFSSMGAIPLQVNRGSSLLWLLLALLFAQAHRQQLAALAARRARLAQRAGSDSAAVAMER